MSNNNMSALMLETETVKMAYDKMVERSAEMNDFLDTVGDLLSQVNDSDTNMYVGNKKPSELREELETFKAEFAPVYQEIQIFANNINAILQTTVNE